MFIDYAYWHQSIPDNNGVTVVTAKWHASQLEYVDRKEDTIKKLFFKMGKDFAFYYMPDRTAMITFLESSLVGTASPAQPNDGAK